ncbi:glycosyltransferase family 4 protein [Streptococcus uberis]|uniref:glycosyltransferase family 4 protein n=1 Tax=Streptococcus uberis TaxID=1349 RepID=UPI003D775A73
MKKKIVGLFSFDGPIYKDRNGDYCSITVTDRMLSRYLDVCDKLYLLVRTFESDKSYIELNMPKLTNKNYEIVEIPNFYSLAYLLNFRNNNEIKNISKYVKDSDLIFARMPSQTSNMVLKACQKLNKPYLVEVGGCAWDSFFNHSLKGKLLAPYMFFQEKRYVKNASFASYVTKYFLQERYPNESNNHLVCSNVYISPEESNIVNKKKNDNSIVIGTTTASIDVKYKGQDSVIKAISILKNKYGINVEYQLVGNGTGDYLKNIAEKFNVTNRISYLGTKNSKEVIDWLKTIDIYIQPSKQEGLPRAVIEALSVGKYTLGTDIAGIPELLDPEFLFKPDDSEKIAELIFKFVNKSDAEIMSVSKRNFEKSLDYSMDKLNLKRKNFFEDYRNFVVGEIDET